MGCVCVLATDIDYALRPFNVNFSKLGLEANCNDHYVVKTKRVISLLVKCHNAGGQVLCRPNVEKKMNANSIRLGVVDILCFNFIVQQRNQEDSIQKIQTSELWVDIR